MDINEDLLETAAYEGVDVHLLFAEEKPTFGDLFLIRGFAHPQFPFANHFNFKALSHLGFDQVDDYFGIRSDEDEEQGDDVKVWLFPLIKGKIVHHYVGPFDGIKLSYSILRNPPEHAELFLKALADFAHHLPVQVFYTLRNQELGNPPDLTQLKNDIKFVIDYWRKQGIEPGSRDALQTSKTKSPRFK